MGVLVEMTGDEVASSVSASMLHGVCASPENKDRVAELLVKVATQRYGGELGKGAFRSVSCRVGAENPYTVYVLVGSEVSKDDRVEIEKAWAGDVG